ncbi:MAG: GyrI-like domain-containing protein [Pseudodesulfovibrio sp.]|nr:GyrI-like domain-containing protein [Pseudodesulfovibrio sp.]MDD3313800.1 GyrI-like domain-containing protein [Pseudodesulfovibrio sp.]
MHHHRRGRGGERTDRPADHEGRPYAIVRHKGPYSGLEQVHAQLMGQWLPESGREFDDGKSLCAADLNRPDSTPPDERLTDVRLPLK